MKPEREFTIPAIGLLQWWSDAPWPNIHWYVGEDQRPYQVALDQEGQPVYIGDIDGNHIHTIVTPAPAAQDVLI